MDRFIGRFLKELNHFNLLVIYIKSLNSLENKLKWQGLSTTNTEVFNDYMENILFPNLTPRTSLIMDNVGFHDNEYFWTDIVHGSGVNVCPTSRFTPNKNLSELCFGGVKNKLRKYRIFGKQNVIRALYSLPYELMKDWSSVIYAMGYG